ncbi:MAG: POTRA domain-containing protein [Fusobacterium sp.]|uniref:POTRA domain-containing protein n=1 Tax=Fusobacterium sp. TaxID=68766 RepID=UPI0026DD724A|nr:POTRA domain-containing protein [Fusobacterium sp.]MDO4691118.1 POTRA domain-containing protein [Fusobacterium sp.]
MFKKVLFCFFTFMIFSYVDDLFEIEKRRDNQSNIVLKKFQINRFLKKYIGKNLNVYSLIKDLKNKSIEKGYITTRVGLNLEKSSLFSANISLFVLKEKIEKVFYDNQKKDLKFNKEEIL